MKTTIPTGIGSIEQAIAFLTELHTNGEAFHPEDDATDIVGDPFTKAEGESLNALMLDIYALPGNDGRHTELLFDPCEYLIYLGHVDDDFTISNDGVVITLKDYVEANEWKAVHKYLLDIMSLNVGDEWPMPVHFGFTMIRRIK